MKKMNPPRRNKNRGYKQLRVWEDAAGLYVAICLAVKGWPFEYKKVASQLISSADSVHRNIAEGYARRSIREYLNFLNIGLGSLAETVSSLDVYHRNQQFSDDQFEELDSLSFKLENGLLKLVESLEHKRGQNDWVDSLIVQESNTTYG